MRVRAWADSCTRAASTLLLLLLILASPALASQPKFPALTGRVVDEAGVLSASTQSQLTDMLAAHERATGEQVVVVTLDSLQGYTIEDYGYQLGRYWGIGQKGKNTGAILIVAPKEHKVRIEVGYGLEGQLTDATSATIIQNYILPSFKRGDFNAGVIAGTSSILKVLGGKEVVEPGNESNESQAGHALSPDEMIFLALLVWIVLVFILNRLRGPNQIVRPHTGVTMAEVSAVEDSGAVVAAAASQEAADPSAAEARREAGDYGRSIHARGATEDRRRYGRNRARHCRGPMRRRDASQ